MKTTIFLIFLFVSVMVWDYTGKEVFWMYLEILTLSWLIVFLLSGAIMKLGKSAYGTTYIYRKEDKADFLGIAFAICFVVICGGAVLLAWCGVPWFNILVAVAVIPVWLLLIRGVNRLEDRGDLAIGKLFFLFVFIGGFLYFGFYEAIGVLIVTAGIRAFVD